MREDMPSAELQNLHPVPSDGEMSQRWARSINRACTAWLLARGLLDPATEECEPAEKAAGGLAGPAGEEGVL